MTSSWASLSSGFGASLAIGAADALGAADADAEATADGVAEVADALPAGPVPLGFSSLQPIVASAATRAAPSPIDLNLMAFMARSFAKIVDAVDLDIG